MQRIAWLIEDYCNRNQWERLLSKKPDVCMNSHSQREIALILDLGNELDTKLSEEVYDYKSRVKLLFDALIRSTNHWASHLSNNPNNKREVEAETKILRVKTKKLVQNLTNYWAKRLFYWDVDDLYLDFPWNELEKNWVIFRIRIKIENELHWKKDNVKVYYTIKRKIDEEDWKLRRCYEKEYQLDNPWELIDTLYDLWIVPYRRKFKGRYSYYINKTMLWKSELNGIKLDLDSYPHDKIDDLLEIEVSSPEEVELIIGLLRLNKKERFTKWSRKLFEHLGVEYDYINEDSHILVPQKRFVI